MKNILLLFFACLSFGSIYSQTVKINITGIRNNAGSIRLAFYSTSESFENKKPLFYKTVSKTQMQKGTLTVSYDLKASVYGIALLDDENNNQEMDYGMVMPKEGFGFSDYYHSGWSSPTFDKFDFTLKNEIKTIQIKIRYL